MTPDSTPVTSRATVEDATTILALQKLAFRSEAELYGDWSIPPMVQSLDSLIAEFSKGVVLQARVNGRLVGSVRAARKGKTCAIGGLIVHPQYQGRGIGSMLPHDIEGEFSDVEQFELFTGSRSAANLRLYQRHGYRISRTEVLSPNVSLTFLWKPAANP
jgi:ribosomal protein S18 acetylase RimI-like enzyme